MTALQTIIKEAKSLKAKYPKRYSKWTDYVKQASAIYAAKHKGKSPVGKKKVVKKAIIKGLKEKKYKIINNFPSLTIFEWIEQYKRFIQEFYSTPLEKRKGLMFQDFMIQINKVQKFLKTKGIKFI